MSLATVVAITVTTTGNNPPKSQTVPSVVTLVAKTAIGVGLIALGIRQRRRIGATEEAQETAEVAGRGRQHVAPVRGRPRSASSAVGSHRGRCRHGGRRQGVERRELAPLFFFCVLATSSYIALELYACFRPDKSEVLLTKIRTWGESHTDQIIIIGCLVLGFWLIANSIYLIVT